MCLDTWRIYAGVVTMDENDGAWGQSAVRLPYMSATISIADCVPKDELRYVVVHEMAHILTAHLSHVAHGLIGTLPEHLRTRESKLISDGDETVTELITRIVIGLGGKPI